MKYDLKIFNLAILLILLDTGCSPKKSFEENYFVFNPGKNYAESEALIVRNVSKKGLMEGNLGLVEKVSQDYDVKSFTGDIPAMALAIGKLAIDFTENPQETELPDLSNYWDVLGKTITSTTGELFWDYSERGYFSINTPETQGVVGFAGSKIIDLGDVKIQMKNPFGIILVTSLEKERPLSKAGKILITTLAKGKNTGMEYNSDNFRLLAKGEAPAQLEGIITDITFISRKPSDVHILDHIGVKTGEKLTIDNGKIRLDGTRYKTLYYLVEF